MNNLTNSKLIILSVIILLLTNSSLFSQEERENKKPRSMIAGFVVKNAPSRNYDDKSVGALLSFRYNCFDTTRNVVKTGIGVNAGYMHYKDNGISKNDYSLTVEINNCFGKNNKSFNGYWIVITELGIIYKDIEDNKIRGLLGVNTGLGIPINYIIKNACVEILFRIQTNTFDKFYCGAGAGFSYSF